MSDKKQTNPSQTQNNGSNRKLSKNILKTPLDKIAVNPFINQLKFSYFDYFKVYGFGSLLFFLRILPMAFFIFFATFVASASNYSLKFLNLIRIPTKKLRHFAKYLVFRIIRFSLFFAGFYWIRVTDKRGEIPKDMNPTIIPIGPHSSIFDIISLLTLGVPAIVSRFENSKMFFVGSILALCEPVYVNRENKDSRAKATTDIKDRALVDNIMLFPEGTCHNGKSLIQFKLGAFLPQLPVQPVVIKWNVGKLDTKSWVEEGPGIIKILFYTLGRMWTSCEIIKLPPIAPNEEEKRDARIFADNVQKVMCEELEVLPSFYSYDDVMFMGFANEIQLFRSPVCIKLMKVCFRLANEMSTQTMKGMDLSKKTKAPKLSKIFGHKYLGLGEDFEHTRNVPDYYIPKILLKMNIKQKKVFKPKITYKSSDAKRLPMSGVVRNPSDTSKCITSLGLDSDIAQQKRYVYETFCTLIENSINSLEQKEEIRAIESTKDLAQLLGLEKYPNSSVITKSSTFVDLLKTIEFSTSSGPTTLHLLTALHLCDCREPNLWERIRAAINLLDLLNKSDEENTNREPTLTLQNFKTFLWYSLGLQQFNDEFLTRSDFDFEFIKNNLKTLFKRATEENAPTLV